MRILLNNKSNINQAFWVGVGSFSTFTVAILSAALLSRFLNKEEYGTYRQILYVYNTLIVIFTAGLPRVYNYFLPRYNLSQGKEIVNKITKVLFLTGFLFSTCLFLSSSFIADILKNPELARGLKIFSPIPLLLLPTLGIEGIFSTYKKTIYLALYNSITRIIIFCSTVFPVIFFSADYTYAVYGWIFSSSLTFFIAYVFKDIPFKNIKAEKSTLDIKEILSFCLPLVTASIAGTLFRSANQFYISRNFGTETFAEFSNGFMEIPFVHMITGATSTVLMPIFSKLIYEKSDTEIITRTWHNALQKSAILIYPMVVFCLFFSKQIVTILFSSSYIGSSVYFSIAMIVNFFNVIVFAPLLLSLGESKFYARLHYGMAISVWLLEYIFIQLFKTPITVAVTFVTISIVGMIVPLRFCSKKLHIPFFELFPIIKLFFILLHSVISIIIAILIFKLFQLQINNLISITIIGITYVCILLLLSYIFKIKYKEVLNPLIFQKKE